MTTTVTVTGNSAPAKPPTPQVGNYYQDHECAAGAVYILVRIHRTASAASEYALINVETGTPYAPQSPDIEGAFVGDEGDFTLLPEVTISHR